MASAWAPFHLVSAQGLNSTVVVNSAKQLGVVIAYNAATAPQTAFIKFYNQTSAPNVGTDTVVWTVPVPPGELVVFSSDAIGVTFSTGIGIGITSGPADSDTSPVVPNQVVVSLGTG